MKTTFIFVRHAQSVANELKIIQGAGLTVPLSELGVRQAAELAEVLRGGTFDKIFSSTAVRATETARAVRAFHASVPYEEVELFHERSKGTAEGMQRSEFEKAHPVVMEAWEREEDVRPPGGESFEDVERRVMPIIESHLLTYEGKTLLYIIHGNVIRAILGALLDIPSGKRARVSQVYCAINLVEFDHDRRLWKVRLVNGKHL